jgi:hypothetical protein
MVAGALHNSTGENWHTTSLKEKVIYCRNWFNDPSNSFKTKEEWLKSCGQVYPSLVGWLRPLTCCQGTSQTGVSTNHR